VTTTKRRTAVIVDGPLAGRDTRVLLTLTAPRFCSKPAGGVWLHHVRDGDSFRYVGTCDEAGHDDGPEVCDEPSEHGHMCFEVGPHDRHRCCCGTETPR
jgi:hypothetical protein